VSVGSTSPDGAARPAPVEGMAIDLGLHGSWRRLVLPRPGWSPALGRCAAIPVALLVVDGTQHADGRVPAPSVVDGFEPVDGRRACPWFGSRPGERRRRHARRQVAARRRPHVAAHGLRVEPEPPRDLLVCRAPASRCRSTSVISRPLRPLTRPASGRRGIRV